MEESAWIKSCSNVFRLKKDSRGSGRIILEAVYSKKLEQILNLSKSAMKMMEDVAKMDFDIFAFKRETNDNELVCLSSMILNKHQVFA